MLNNGCEYAVVEASSHGLSKKTNRLGNILFDAVAMMNVTHEHLEFHGTHEQYKSDKANLFRALDTHAHVKNIINAASSSNKSLELGSIIETVPAFGVVNLEDPSANYFISSTKHKVFGFTTHGEAGASLQGIENQNTSKDQEQLDSNQTINSHIQAVWKGTNISSDTRGVNFTFSGPDTVTQSKINITQPNLRINLPGTFNVYNTMAAILLVAGMLQIPTKTVISCLEDLRPVKGRMTLIDQGQPFEVLVDYAHTPSSFRTIFPPLRKQLIKKNTINESGRLMCLFGSGGERDVKKRPEQGKIAAQYCDIVFLCDEDPRKEDPIKVIEDIAAGCETNETIELRKNTIIGSDAIVRDKSLFLITDRPTAIRKMFSIAKKGDIVLLLGKAHENSIIYKDYAMPYDEITEVKKALEEMGYKK